MALQNLGLVKTSLVDYPGLVSATLFTPGCNFRCPYCHNPGLVFNDNSEEYFEIKEIFAFLERRRAILDGVCITGGEPLMHRDIGSLIREIRAMGFKVKIDTNGSFPEVLAALSADYIALDIKTSLSKYAQLLPSSLSSNEIYAAQLAGKIQESITYIRQSGIPHEFRTTVVPRLVTLEDMHEITELIGEGEQLYLNQFRNGRTLSPAYRTIVPYRAAVLEDMRQAALDRKISCRLRLA